MINIFLKFVFIFYLGSTVGWVFELFFRRIIHKKWINPGFLIGPYLPIYGFGLVTLTIIYLVFKDSSQNPIIIILLMGLLMTLIEFIGGVFGLKNNVRLWDYRDRWLNYKGIICPLFSLIWTIASALYYFYLVTPIMSSLKWFDNNLAFSYILGIFTGLIVIDTIYSSKLYIKVKNYARENDITIKYEQLKESIKEAQIKSKEKYSFFIPFKHFNVLAEQLTNYIDNASKGKHKKIKK